MAERVIDIDPELLERSADAAVHAAQQGLDHVAAEIVGDIPKLIETLTVEGPYAYLDQARSSTPTAASTCPPRQHGRRSSTGTRSCAASRTSCPASGPSSTCEASGTRSTNRITRARAKDSGIIYETEVILLLPVTTGAGITGELVWNRMPRESLGLDPSTRESVGDPIAFRKAVFAHHEAYLDALRAADADGVVAVFADGSQSAARDYVEETGTLVVARDRDALKAWYEALFAKFEIRDVDLLHKVVQDWYVFAETRWHVVPREGEDAGRQLSFRVAEFFVAAHDARFIVRIGHGTDPA